MIKSGLVAMMALLICSPAISAAGDMKVETFLAKADALKAKGMLALASSDIGVLKAEGKAAGEEYRARIKSDKAKKLPPHSCPPTKAALKSDDLLAHFRTYSATQRKQISVKTAFVEMMKKRYPC